MKYLTHSEDFQLEGGGVLPELRIAYETYGELNAAADNVIWVCHALTANAEAADWWSGLVGPEKLFDPARHFIVCANMIGSCYGSTGPRDTDPRTGRPYGRDFPLVTIRDMVRAHQLLQAQLGVERIQLAIGGSMGGQQVLEWAIQDPELFVNIVVLASNAQHSPWGIAFNEAQRMAILADPSLESDTAEAGRRGLEAARAIAMLSYRHYRTYHHTQSEQTDEKLDDFLASSYQRYQGLKLHRRFDVLSYLTLSKAMDSHHVGRGRGGIAAALQRIQARALIIGISTDVLFPVEEQRLLARHIPRGRLEVIESLYGHDGFLVESEQIAKLVTPVLNGHWPLNGKHRNRPFKGGIPVSNPVALPGTESF